MQWKWARLEDLPAAELHELLALRQRVFIVEQRCPYQDADALDLEAWHLLGSREASLLAYLRASPPRRDGDAVAATSFMSATVLPRYSTNRFTMLNNPLKGNTNGPGSP